MISEKIKEIEREKAKQLSAKNKIVEKGCECNMTSASIKNVESEKFVNGVHLSSEISKLKSKIDLNLNKIKSEEHTKMAFILPFIQLLGYDITDPSEVVPEYTCDFGIKKGEKVDYCIMSDGKPYILIECKDCRNNLSKDNVS